MKKIRRVINENGEMVFKEFVLVEAKEKLEKNNSRPIEQLSLEELRVIAEENGFKVGNRGLEKARAFVVKKLNE